MLYYVTYYFLCIHPNRHHGKDRFFIMIYVRQSRRRAHRTIQQQHYQTCLSPLQFLAFASQVNRSSLGPSVASCCRSGRSIQSIIAIDRYNVPSKLTSSIGDFFGADGLRTTAAFQKERMIDWNRATGSLSSNRR